VGSVVGTSPETSSSVWGDEWGGLAIKITPGANVFEKKLSLTELTYNTFRLPGVSYSWNFGDGGTSTDAEPTHTYSATGTYMIKVDMRDADYHPASFQTTVVVEPQGNVIPVSAMSVSVSGYTVTVTDLSYDPDYNLNGNSGPGKITILWGNGNDRTEVPINLTDSPSNQVYTYTYPTRTSNWTITHAISDNKGDSAIMPTKMNFLIPEAASNVNISGKLTRASTASSLQGSMLLKLNNVLTSYYSNPNSAGDYEFVNLRPGCYIVVPKVTTGYTFTPVESEPICTSTDGVNFTVTKP
jgi:PKD repeat protein